MTALRDALKRLEAKHTVAPAVEPFSDEEMALVRAATTSPTSPATPERLLAEAAPNAERWLSQVDTLARDLDSEFAPADTAAPASETAPAAAAIQPETDSSAAEVEPLPPLEHDDLLRGDLPDEADASAGLALEPAPVENPSDIVGESARETAFFELTDNVFDIEAEDWSEPGTSDAATDESLTDELLTDELVEDPPAAPPTATSGPDVVLPEICFPQLPFVSLAPLQATTSPPDEAETLDPHQELLPVELRHPPTVESQQAAPDEVEAIREPADQEDGSGAVSGAAAQPATDSNWEVTVDDESLQPEDLDLEPEGEEASVESKLGVEESLREQLADEPHDAAIDETESSTLAIDPVDQAPVEADSTEQAKEPAATDIESNAAEPNDDTSSHHEADSTEAELQNPSDDLLVTDELAAPAPQPPVQAAETNDAAGTSLAAEASQDDVASPPLSVEIPEEYVRLAGAIRHRNTDRGSAVIGFVSPEPLADRGQVVAEIARACVGHIPGEVLAIDAGENPSVSRSLAGAATPEQTARAPLSRTEVYGVRLARAGTGQPSQDLALLARRQFPLTLVDLGSNDAAALDAWAPLCDAVYVVVRLDVTSRQQAVDMVARVKEHRVADVACIVAQSAPAE